MEDKNIVIELYEKMYFYEVEVREKLVSRLQFVLAMIVSLAGGLSYILLNFNQSLSGWKILIFHFLLFLQFITFAGACFYFSKGWTGHKYSYIPDANELDEYRVKLESCMVKEEAGTAFLDYIREMYQEASSKASQLNKKRLNQIHRANICIILSTSALFLTFLWFVFAKLDKNLVTPVAEKSLAHLAEKKDASSPGAEYLKATTVIINNICNNVQGDLSCPHPKTTSNSRSNSSQPESLRPRHRYHKNLSCNQ